MSILLFWSGSVRRLLPVGIGSAESVGAPEVLRTISPSAITTMEAFGGPTLSQGLRAEGIASEEAHGKATIVLIAATEAIASAETFGLPLLSYILRPAGIEARQQVGFPTLVYDVTVYCPSIQSREAFGYHAVVGGLLIRLSSELSYGIDPGQRRVSILPQIHALHFNTDFVRNITIPLPGKPQDQNARYNYTVE